MLDGPSKAFSSYFRVSKELAFIVQAAEKVLNRATTNGMVIDCVRSVHSFSQQFPGLEPTQTTGHRPSYDSDPTICYRGGHASLRVVAKKHMMLTLNGQRFQVHVDKLHTGTFLWIGFV